MNRWVNPWGLLGAALALRLIDLFVLRLDERLGEIILSKALGFVLILLYLRSAGQAVGTLGLHSGGLWQSLRLTVLAVAPVYLLAYVLEFVLLAHAGKAPALRLAAVDPKTGMSGGAAFAAWLLIGNVINSFMEEGLFRGVLLPYFGTRLGLWRANLLQAALFALWHAVWPIKAYVSGQAAAGAAVASALPLLAATMISGLAYGYLYLVTGNLWAPWLAHTLNNSVLNLVHIDTASGLDASAGVRHVVIVLGLAIVVLIIRVLAPSLALPGLTL